ncbi:MAG: O-antigen ligase domain-containing protein [Acidobacteria bacterium]|nr:O-antigen ligase domain-containing protein [Acidobacteriota bacterium]
MIVGIAVAGAWRPAKALLLLAVLTPLSKLILPSGGPPAAVRLAEALVLAFFAGWSVHVLRHRPAAHSSALRTPMWLFVACVIASAAVGVGVEAAGSGMWSLVTQLCGSLAALRPSVPANAQDLLAGVWTFIQHLSNALTVRYLLPSADFPGLPAGALLIEGVALMMAVSMLAAEHPALARLTMKWMAGIGLGVAILNVGALGWEFASGGFSPIRRVSVTLSDLNAAGSYFALILPLVYVEARGISRRATILACGLVLAAAWATGSRAALASVMAIAMLPGATAKLRARGRPSPTLIAVGAGAALLLVLAVVGASVLVGNVPPATATMRIRGQFVETSIRMLQRQPIFGIGIGRYYSSSWSYMPHRLRLEYKHENAHNNFLQIGAELGIAGLALFLWLLAAVLRGLVTGLPRAADSDRALAVLVALCAFLLTCVAGHPLLIPEVAFSFWIVAGLAVAMRRQDEVPIAGAGQWPLTVGIAVLILSVPLRVPGAMRASNWSRVTIGLGLDERAQEGRAFRRILGTATLFVPPHVKSAEVPLHGLSARSDIEVAIVVDGGLTARVPTAPSTWTSADVPVLSVTEKNTFHRIDLLILCRAEQTDCYAPDNGAGVGQISY